MLFDYLDNLRKKPKPQRQRYAFAFALSFTLIITGIWAVTLPGRFTPPDEVAANAGEAPFAGLWRQFKDQVASVRTQTAAVAPGAASSTESTATTSNRVDAVSLIATTSEDGVLVPLPPPPKPVLIGTTSPELATTSR